MSVYSFKSVCVAIIGSITFLVSTFTAQAEKRVALVVGNSSYELAGRLANPLNDANDMALKLEKLGFKVVLGTDLTYQMMRRTLKQFAVEVVGADVALFFYAGHAIQVNGINYLAPVDTDISRETDLEFETVPLNVVQKLMEREAKTQLVFLDACRNNPLTRNLLSGTRSVEAGLGLARQTYTAEGSYIAYATQPGNVALDGNGRNSPFTTALLKNISRPGIEISTLMTDVRKDVYESTKKQQLPWTNSGLLGHFYFLKPDESAISNEVSKEQTEDQQRLNQFTRENVDWDKIKNTNDPTLVKKFLADYPNGILTPIAKYKLEQLENTSKPVVKEESGSETKVAALPSKADEDPITPEPIKEEKPVDRAVIRSIQSEFNRVGCDVGRADGIWGRKSLKALNLYMKHSGFKTASTEPSHLLYQDLQGKTERVCPLVCSVRHNEVNGECVLKSCGSGERLNSKGICIKPAPVTKSKPTKKKVVRKSTRKRTPVKKSSSRNCFKFNGKTVCE